MDSQPSSARASVLPGPGPAPPPSPQEEARDWRLPPSSSSLLSQPRLSPCVLAQCPEPLLLQCCPSCHGQCDLEPHESSQVNPYLKPSLSSWEGDQIPEFHLKASQGSVTLGHSPAFPATPPHPRPLLQPHTESYTPPAATTLPPTKQPLGCAEGLSAPYWGPGVRPVTMKSNTARD